VARAALESSRRGRGKRRYSSGIHKAYARFWIAFGWPAGILSSRGSRRLLGTAMHGLPLTLQRDREELLRARETVWRAWFAADTKTLEKLVPPETIVMSGGEKE
jgi:hypothetical protein